jgi:hypothetical protein
MNELRRKTVHAVQSILKKSPIFPLFSETEFETLCPETPLRPSSLQVFGFKAFAPIGVRASRRSPVLPPRFRLRPCRPKLRRTSQRRSRAKTPCSKTRSEFCHVSCVCLRSPRSGRLPAFNGGGRSAPQACCAAHCYASRLRLKQKSALCVRSANTPHTRLPARRITRPSVPSVARSASRRRSTAPEPPQTVRSKTRARRRLFIFPQAPGCRRLRRHAGDVC